MGRLAQQVQANHIRLLGMLYDAHLYRKCLQRHIESMKAYRPQTRPETRVVKS